MERIVTNEQDTNSVLVSGSEIEEIKRKWAFFDKKENFVSVLFSNQFTESGKNKFLTKICSDTVLR